MTQIGDSRSIATGLAYLTYGHVSLGRLQLPKAGDSELHFECRVQL